MNITDVFKAFKGRPSINVFIAALQITVILYAGSSFYKTTKEGAFNEFNQGQLVMAAEAAGDIKLYFSTLAGAMRALGKMPGILDFNEHITRLMLTLEYKDLKRFGVNEISIINSEGILRYNTRANDVEGKDFSLQGYFKEAKEIVSKDMYIVDFLDLKDVSFDKDNIVVAVPMFAVDDNVFPNTLTDTFSGVVICTLKLDILAEQIQAPLSFSNKGHLFLMNSESRALLVPDKSFFGKNMMEEASDFPAFKSILGDMISGNAGTANYLFHRFDASLGVYLSELEEQLIAYAPVNIGKKIWTLGIWASKERADVLIHSAYLNQILMVAVVILIILIGPAYSLAMSFRYNITLEKEVDLKTGEFKAAHQRLITILDSLDASVYVADMETYELLFGNKFLQDIYGDITGKTCWRELHPDQSGPCEFCTKSKLINSNGKPSGINVWEFENSVTGKWYEIHDRAISWVDGRIVRLEIATDISSRKLVEEELKQAHSELGTFCQILKKIGVQRELDGVRTFLINELQHILKTQYMQLLMFSSDRCAFFALSDRGTRYLDEAIMVRQVMNITDELDKAAIVSHKQFTHPVLADYFPEKGLLVAIPIRDKDRAEGILIAAYESDHIYDKNNIHMATLILEHASGTIKRAVLHEEEIYDLRKRIERTSEFRGIIGKSPKMQEIYKLIKDVAPTDATILVQGESGTGKELVALAIHRQSPRKEKPFVVINCAAYPETLLESELFGHEKGAFTGAAQLKIGRFEQADGGTVFLDEIGEISPSAQIKLLRVLQNHEFERLGGEESLLVDVRTITATNKDLQKEVAEGRFREDLFYRLNVIPIYLPPLRERINDIPIMVRHFQNQFSSEHGEKIQGFSSEVMQKLMDYHWPGNVRELENSIEHAMVLAKGKRVEISHLPSVLWDDKNLTSQEPVGSYKANEKKLLIRTLAENNWNKKQTALSLGISRSSLYNKLKKYSIKKPVSTKNGTDDHKWERDDIRQYV